MKIICIYIYKIILKIIYFFLKLLPTQKKIVFISRQTNDINLDFTMLKNEIHKQDPTIKMVFICQRIEKKLSSKLKYFFSIFRQMHHLATSKVCIIDSYCIPVSILKHKKKLFILQIWHSIGKIKKSGYQTLGLSSGRDEKLAKIMCMHKNYTKIIAGGKAFDKYYELGFNTTKDKLLHYGLPRIDYLLETEEKTKKEILKKYPEFKNKKIVYYAPTFRTYEVKGPEKLFEQTKKEDFILIVKPHPNQPLNLKYKHIYNCPEFKSVDLLTISDYVITDYSSISLEAAALNKKVLFYVYDYEKYIKNNGINLDPVKVMPKLTSKDINDLLKIIKNDTYDIETFEKFKKEYLPNDLGKSTKLIVNYIMKYI